MQKKTTKNKHNTKYIIITGGVISGIGKGIVTASLGRIMKSMNFNTTAIKIDPYINIDAGTLRPTEHGEVFVTEDGGEIDQDFGHYERFLCDNSLKEHNITTGKVYRRVITKERNGDFIGKTVQVIPHITDEIKKQIKEISNKKNSQITLIEIGGIVGDYENIIFLEAMRQLSREEDIVFIHVSYVPVPEKLGEPKTKPTQQSVRLLMEIGIQPDFIVCRSVKKLDCIRKQKISLFCNVLEENIIDDPDLETIYELPLIFEEQEFSKKILNKLKLNETVKDLNDWKNKVKILKKANKEIKIGIVGKYLNTGNSELKDSYISVAEAIKHAGIPFNTKINIKWIDSNKLSTSIHNSHFPKKLLGIIVPGGFGTTGIDGKIKTIEYCRKNNIPFLGICLGLQLSVIEFARNVCNLRNANSTEINKNTEYPVIDILSEQKNIKEKGGTMRLGSNPALLKSGTKIYELYKKFGLLNTDNIVYERHRHRYEINSKYHDILQNKGLTFSGISPNKKLIEFIEITDHKFFVATQAHPEFKSNLLQPTPLFYGFVESCLN